MSKFIKMECGSLVNSSYIVNVKLVKTRFEDDVRLISCVVTDTLGREYFYRDCYFDYSLDEVELIDKETFSIKIMEEIETILNNNEPLEKTKVNPYRPLRVGL